jgi:lactate dehydrogenase-like 2-hydroxyacid dehydrogenase
MKLGYFESHGEEKEELAKRLPDLEVVAVTEPLHKSIEQAKDADLVSVFVGSQVTGEHLAEMPQLKFIAARSAGYDHIDIATCRARGIVVSNVPSYGDNTVAEHAFALILALSRKNFQSYERTEKMDFDREGLEGFDLKGKTLGVVGCGAIGKHAAKIGRGFDMKVVIYDVKPDAAFAAKIGATLVDSLDELLAQSDVITLHVPYIPKKTHHLINKENITLVKPGAILVNTARGSVVDTAAIPDAIASGQLAGAGIDVLEKEPPPDADPLVAAWRDPHHPAYHRLIINPHSAFYSEQGLLDMRTKGATACRRAILGEVVRNVVN